MPGGRPALIYRPFDNRLRQRAPVSMTFNSSDIIYRSGFQDRRQFFVFVLILILILLVIQIRNGVAIFIGNNRGITPPARLLETSGR